MRKALHYLTIFLVFTPLAFQAQASPSSPPIALHVNGKELTSDPGPILKEGRTLVPLRVIAEGMGWDVGWDEETQAVRLSDQKDIWITFHVNSPHVQSYLGDKVIDVAPVVYKQRTMVPLRVVGDTLGMEVDWVPGTATLPARVFLNPKDNLSLPSSPPKSFDSSPLSTPSKVLSMGFTEEELAYLLQTGLTAKEQELFDGINRYRAENGLPAFDLHRDLVTVARTHVVDSMRNSPMDLRDTRGIQGNLHSWSLSPYWSGGAYTSDHAYADIMWHKPRELTNFSGNGYENAYYQSGSASPSRALYAWKNSAGHRAVILGEGPWARMTQMGLAIEGEYAFLWFAE